MSTITKPADAKPATKQPDTKPERTAKPSVSINNLADIGTVDQKRYREMVVALAEGRNVDQDELRAVLVVIGKSLDEMAADLDTLKRRIEAGKQWSEADRLDERHRSNDAEARSSGDLDLQWAQTQLRHDSTALRNAARRTLAETAHPSLSKRNRERQGELATLNKELNLARAAVESHHKHEAQINAWREQFTAWKAGSLPWMSKIINGDMRIPKWLEGGNGHPRQRLQPTEVNVKRATARLKELESQIGTREDKQARVREIEKQIAALRREINETSRQILDPIQGWLA